MKRRALLRGVFAGVLHTGITGRVHAMTPEEMKQHRAEYRRKALEHFPFKLIETTGDQALEKWRELKSAGEGYPVVLGGDDGTRSFDNLLLPFGPGRAGAPPLPPVEDILRAAAGISFPDDLAKQKKVLSESALRQFKERLAANPDMPLPRITEMTLDGQTRVQTREETIARLERESSEPPLGDWPASPNASVGLSIVYDLYRKPLPKVYIGLAPTDDWTAIPAYLHWGGWNDCPATEHHVAAMRRWRDRYGAELVGMTFDTIIMRVARRPESRDEVLALAREQYVYCPDNIDQGVSTYRALAADLMANDWWSFWWD